jgi:Na+/melibiose symporter-like transporter
MNDRVRIDLAAAPVLGEAAHFRITLLIEGALSFAANLLFIGIFFYTKEVFGWGLMRNFMLASAQGAVYVLASLASQGLAKRVGDRRLLIGSNLALAGVSLVGVLVSSPVILVGVIIVYVPLMALNWPVLEAAAAAGADPHTLSRRIGVYNLVWAGTGALAVAVQGTLLKIDARMVFLVPLVVHVAMVGIIVVVRGYGVGWSGS